MKKLLALALTALMMVCAVVPAFADDAVATDTLPELFEDATVVNIHEQWETANEFTWGADTCYPWNNGDFTAGGQYEPLGRHSILLTGADFVYNIVFTPDEDGAYSFALYLANKTTKGNGKDPLDETKAGAFTVTLKKADAVIATYTITEVQPAELGSRLYYHFADNVALEADTEYTMSFQLAAATDTALADFLYVLPGAADDAADDTSADATEDTSADATEDTSADATEDTSADATEDTSADATGDDVAPETFDVAVIALAVAGASAAAAYISKKRR